MLKKRIETGISKTARWTMIARAVSNSEDNSFYKSGDYLAKVFIPGFEKNSRRLLMKMMCRYFTAKGGYEQIIARTKYIDDIFSGIGEDVAQILILGAGFDMRAVRYKNLLTNKTVFELDSYYTQKAKTGWLTKIKFDLPSNLKFVGANFDKESLAEKLDGAGYMKNKKNLILLEGLLPYLKPESVAALFKTISEYNAAGSTIVFDYLYKSAINQEDIHKGKNKMIKYAAKAGEKCLFGLEKNELSGFLSQNGFDLLEESDSEKLEKKYFTDEKGCKRVHIRGSHGSMVTAIKT